MKEDWIHPRARPGRGARVLVLALGLGGAVVAPARPPSTQTVYAVPGAPLTMEVAGGEALIREEREVVFTGARQWLVLEDLPLSAHVERLNLLARRFPIELHQWGRATPGVAPRVRHPQISDGDVRWGRSPMATGIPLRVRMDAPVVLSCTAPVEGPRRVDLVYSCAGISWSAAYELLIRPASQAGDVWSADLGAAIVLENNTARAFSGAEIRLASRPGGPAPARTGGPGFLMLEKDSLLSDLWEPRHIPVEPGRSYRVPEPVDVPAMSRSDIPYIRARRIPARQVWRMKAGDVPAGRASGADALFREITLSNRAEHRLGKPLPPGRVTIRRGMGRGALWTESETGHVNPGGIMRCGLGHDPLVTGRRRTLREQRRGGGAVEGRYAVVVDNARTEPIDVVIEARPAVSVDWELLSASSDAEVTGDLIELSSRVPAESSHRVMYRVRYRTPGL